MTETVLCYIKNEKSDEYLFIHRDKRLDDYNYGKYLGVGGHIEKDEKPIDAIIREIKEETGFSVKSDDLFYLGRVLFRNKKAGFLYEEVMHLYKCNNYYGKLSTCDEGTFYWINTKNIYDLNLWEGDKCFLEYVLSDNTHQFDMVLNYIDDKFISKEIE